MFDFITFGVIMSYPFNVRVYGLLIEENQRILLSDEYYNKTFITKFPGGGLNFGEGPVECIKREFLEELTLHVDVLEHFYTTDFFQPSAFNLQMQIISIYYLVQPKEKINIKTSEKKYDFLEIKEENQAFRWLDIKKLTEHEMTFPIDKKVAKMIANKFIK